MATMVRDDRRGTGVRRLPLSNFWAKITMAVTGLLFVAFVAVHMFGNLKVYTGREHFNEYAHWLREILVPFLPYEGVLWILRIVLLGSLAAHVACAVLLAWRAKRARGPVPRRGLALRSFTARTMLVSGIVLLLFVIFHVLDLTLGAQPVAAGGFVTGDAYGNLIASFQRPIVAIFYILAMIVLTAHLLHGIWAAAIDLGATGKRLRAVAAWAAFLVSAAILLGNISIPLAVMIGVLR